MIETKFDDTVEALYKKEEIRELTDLVEDLQKDLTTERGKVHQQGVLIRQAEKVVTMVDNLVPGLLSGEGFMNFNPLDLMGNDGLSALQPEIQKLGDLLAEWKKTNVTVKQPALKVVK